MNTAYFIMNRKNGLPQGGFIETYNGTDIVGLTCFAVREEAEAYAAGLTKKYPEAVKGEVVAVEVPFLVLKPEDE